jgi:hypothetical protein
MSFIVEGPLRLSKSVNTFGILPEDLAVIILEGQMGGGNHNENSRVPPLKGVLHSIQILIFAIFKHFDNAVVKFITVEEPILNSPISDSRDGMTILLPVIGCQMEIAPKTHLSARICD